MLTYAGKVIHADPVSMYADYATLPKADLILITHEHRRSPGYEGHPGGQHSQYSNCCQSGFRQRTFANGIVLKNGEDKTVSGIKIEAVPAYNPEKPFHPKGNGNGYILTFGDKRVYIAGDTENVPEIKALKNIDVAFLPMNLPYTMTPEQVADVAKVDAAEGSVSLSLRQYGHGQTRGAFKRREGNRGPHSKLAVTMIPDSGFRIPDRGGDNKYPRAAQRADIASINRKICIRRDYRIIDNLNPGIRNPESGIKEWRSDEEIIYLGACSDVDFCSVMFAGVRHEIIAGEKSGCAAFVAESGRRQA